MTFTIPVPGAQLNAADDGAGDPLILLHAGIADLRSWDAMVPLLVDAGFRVVRYDQRGFGRTETDDVEFSNRADLIAVLDALGIDRAALVGNSRGGQVAFDTAIEFPDRVVAVVGVGAGIGGFEHDPTPEEAAIFEELERLEDADPPDVAGFADSAVRLWVDGLGQPPDRVASPIREAIREMTGHQPRTRQGQRPTDRARSAGGRPPCRPAVSGPRGRGRPRHVVHQRRVGAHRGERAGRTGGGHPGCRPHDRDGAAGRAGGPDHGLPRSVPAVDVSLAAHPGPAFVELSPELVEAMVDHARAEYPNEMCGLIVGDRPAADGGRALRWEPARNRAASPMRYDIHPDDLYRLTVDTDDAGEVFWAIVHSHTHSPPRPSGTDIGLAFYPDALYLLVSLADPEPALAAWRIVAGEVFPVELLVATDA